ncbi:pseudouridylate synthase-like protein [Trypanosoma conorhini]|uniref:Pseudouridylate synthase-like protein n=1 Tax=Trypanosoma conorhini TaxID=83891 RepID=A0A422PZI0_9TRYP|nr:pseudouridylate synthase-like protein [Trypanosoma conorhini]RNF23153.1 pseudouridylate synthase-like protein [Trypanosoma conorhini]
MHKYFSFPSAFPFSLPHSSSSLLLIDSSCCSIIDLYMLRVAARCLLWRPAAIQHLPDFGSKEAPRKLEDTQRQYRPLSLKARQALAEKSDEVQYHVITQVLGLGSASILFLPAPS